MVMTLLPDLSLGSLSRKTFDCREKCSIDSSGTFLIIVVTNIEMS